MLRNLVILRFIAATSVGVICAPAGTARLCAAEQDAAVPSSKKGSEAALRRFLISTKDTAGWNPVKGTISYDFFPDGRLHIQGPDGEATMWEGKWSLQGDQLTLINSDTKKKSTVTAAISGKELLLDGQVYRRYRP
jgi:hypothetical protein